MWQHLCREWRRGGRGDRKEGIRGVGGRGIGEEEGIRERERNRNKGKGIVRRGMGSRKR